MPKRETEIEEASTLDDAWTDWSASANATGFSGTPNEVVRYKKIGTVVIVQFHFNGTSNAGNITFTLPYSAVAKTVTSLGTAVFWKGTNGLAWSDGAQVGSVLWKIDDTTATLLASSTEASFASTGTKEATGQLAYETS